MSSVFFYGLFMDTGLLRQKGLEPGPVQLARVHGWGLRIGERATLVEAADETSFGILTTLEGDALTRLYQGDGLDDYFAQALEVRLEDGGSVRSASYILDAERLSGHNRDYALRLAVVARKIGLPAHYIEEIASWAQ